MKIMVLVVSLKAHRPLRTECSQFYLLTDWCGHGRKVCVPQGAETLLSWVWLWRRGKSSHQWKCDVPHGGCLTRGWGASSQHSSATPEQVKQLSVCNSYGFWASHPASALLEGRWPWGLHDDSAWSTDSASGLPWDVSHCDWRLCSLLIQTLAALGNAGLICDLTWTCEALWQGYC